MADPLIFEKTIERDSTFVTQGVWSAIMAGENHLGFAKGNPYAPVIIHYATPDNLQIWENDKALEWFLDRLLEKNQDAAFLAQVAADQKAVLQAIRPYWDSGSVSDPAEIEAYFKIMEPGLTNITMMYYTGMDERSPQAALDIAAEVRKDDEFFAKNDIFITECVKARGYDESLGAVVMPHELAQLPPKETLEERRRGCVLVGGEKLFPGTLESFAAMHPEYAFAAADSSDARVSEVKGQVAQKGKVRGVVRIVKNRKQANEVQEGEVIVSPMTTPDFIGAMRKAAAFVTDEGGIVCHAAIVARELKKPCVIGTKFATQVFKDGDMVEVDAEKGIVRLIQA